MIKRNYVFDIDGTIYRGNLSVDFFWYLQEKGVIWQLGKEKLYDLLMLRSKVDSGLAKYEDYLQKVCNTLEEWLVDKELATIEEYAVEFTRTIAVNNLVKSVAHIFKEACDELKGVNVYVITGGLDFLAMAFLDALCVNTGNITLVASYYNYTEEGKFQDLVASYWSHSAKEDAINFLNLKDRISHSFGNTMGDFPLFVNTYDTALVVNPTKDLYSRLEDSEDFIANLSLVLEKRGMSYSYNQGAFTIITED